MFTNNKQRRRGNLVVNLLHSAGRRVLQWDHRQICFAVFDPRKSVFKGETWYPLIVRVDVDTGELGIGAWFPLKGNR